MERPTQVRHSDNRPPAPPTVRATASRVRPYTTRVLTATAVPHGPDLAWTPRAASEEPPQATLVRPYLIAHEQRERARASAARSGPGTDLPLGWTEAC
ncbi:hypothetical protein NI17_023135 [Thermobifida halotolerans]|uniref:Uncharacterized protein n=1 Tax=Thermobifida halotolerans TaxID=483545 RepID=A0AA97LX53_9ACTN|nr:hypothetical protein [Thermobifida halotolerans]UOE19566.1 hypothetical protein NI17_023135 [Thermobifida halotolerans]